jgi:hypothetical protein
MRTILEFEDSVPVYLVYVMLKRSSKEDASLAANELLYDVSNPIAAS